MIINELICKPDGTQEIQQREVPDDFFNPPTQLPTTEEKLAAFKRSTDATISVMSAVIDTLLA